MALSRTLACARACTLAFVIVASLVAPSAADARPRHRVRPPAGAATTLFYGGFGGSDGLITNEWAYWNPGNPLAVVSSAWEMTSGSLFRKGETAWSGVPDDRAPDARSTTGTNSAIFRLTTKRHDFGNVAVSFRLRNDGLTSTPSTPAVDWDGIHVFLRYQSEYNLYYASVNRRDNTVVIKKKCAGGPSNGGTYYALGQYRPHTVSYGTWQFVRATVRNVAGGGVAITLAVNGTVVASATDTGVGCAPITHAGATGIRGDNANFRLDDFKVTALS